jgi:hypothetical protein
MEIYPSKSHEVLNGNATIVAVAVDAESSETGSRTFGKWVGGNTITGLKANFGLEGVFSDSAYHLEGNVRTVEQSSVIR